MQLLKHGNYPVAWDILVFIEYLFGHFLFIIQQ